MHVEPIETTDAAPALPAFTIDGATIAAALKILATLPEKMPGHARQPDGRYCVLIDAGDGAIKLTATDLETVASIILSADVATPGRCAVPAAALSDAFRKLPKGSQASFSTADGRALLTAGRARFTAPLCDVETFPQFPLVGLTPAEDWELPGHDPEALGDGRAEGLVISAAAGKMLAKAVKRATPPKKSGADMPAAQIARYELAEAIGEGGWQNRNPRLVVALGDMSVTAQLTEPAFDYRTKRNPWTYGFDGERTAKAAEYARHLRTAYALPDVGHEGRLEYRDGLAVGMTFGEPYWDASEYRAAPGFEVPAEHVIITDGAYVEIEVDGVRYARLGEAPWQRWHVGTGQLAYPAGSYSVFFPKAERPVISEILLTVDGREIAVATNGSGKINLSAEEIAELAGPVSEMTRVEIAPMPMFQGERVPAGLVIPKPPKISDRDAARMTAAEMAAYCEACRPCLAPAERIAAENAAAEAVATFARDAAARPEPSNVIAVDFAAAAAERDAAEATSMDAPAADMDAPAPDADLTPPVQSTSPGNAALLAMVERLASRVEALESGKAPPAEPTSVRQLPRALRLRIVGRYLAMRARRALDAGALVASRDYLAKVETGHAEAIERAEATAGALRAELAEALAESARRNAARVEAETRATEAEAAEEAMRVELAELREVEAENDVLFEQLATFGRRRRGRDAPAAAREGERVSAPITLAPAVAA